MTLGDYPYDDDDEWSHEEVIKMRQITPEQLRAAARRAQAEQREQQVTARSERWRRRWYGK